jgi:serine-type D-Ala-D-Ala carboxypeptidase/endopeptidase
LADEFQTRCNSSVSEIARLLSRVARRAPVVVIGTLNREETTVEFLGDGTAATRETIFEIGSVTKTFTALLLAQMCESGEVALRDPLSKFLPEARASAVTLVDLATHTARLPGIPRDLLLAALRNRSNPYAGYGEDQLMDALGRVRPRRGLGKKFKYSNFGFALLGTALERAAGMPYQELLIDRICHPLGLTNTVASVTPDTVKRFASGHKRVGKPVNAWDLASFAPAGVLKSTADDMLSYVSAHLDPENTLLPGPLREVQRLRVHIHKNRLGIGLGWLLRSEKGRTYLWHNGGTGGFSSFVGFSPEGEQGVVALANARVAGPLTRFGTRWLEKGPE